MTALPTTTAQPTQRPVPAQSLRDIVDYMRKHPDDFAEFRHSATYKLFEPPIFENKKKNQDISSNLLVG